MKSSFLRKLVIGTFLSVPAISSIISTIHLIDLFNLGNPTWLSILLAVTFELGSIASLLAISVIDRIKTGAIWFIFFILSGLQIIGNVYYSYSFTSDQILSNPTFLTNFMDLFSFITGDEIKDVKIFLSCIIGIPIPLIALFFLKSNIDYLKPNKSNVSESNEEQKNVYSETEQPTEETTVGSEPTMDEKIKPEKNEEIHEVSEMLDEHTRISQEIGGYEETQFLNQQETVGEDNTYDIKENDEIHTDAERINRRMPKPMISRRREDTLSVLHRG